MCVLNTLKRIYGVVNSELLTPKEVATILKVPISWVYERTRNRMIPVRKLGRHVRISRTELEEWIEREGAEKEGNTKNDF